MPDLADLSLGAVVAGVLLLSAFASQRDLGIGLKTALPALTVAVCVPCALLIVTGMDWRPALALAVLLIVCGLIAEIDRRSLIIPDLLVLAVVSLALVSAFSPPWDQRVAGAALLGGLFLVVRSAFYHTGRPDALGLGDVKLAAAMGAMVGPQHGLIAVAIAGVATLCGMLWPLVRGAPGATTALSGASAPFGIGLAAALFAVSALRVWGGA